MAPSARQVRRDGPAFLLSSEASHSGVAEVFATYQMFHLHDNSRVAPFDIVHPYERGPRGAKRSAFSSARRSVSVCWRRFLLLRCIRSKA
jgi:hypothetical protein